MMKNKLKIVEIFVPLLCVFTLISGCKIIPVREKSDYEHSLEFLRKGNLEQAEAYLLKYEKRFPYDEKSYNLRLEIAKKYLERNDAKKTSALVSKIPEKGISKELIGGKYEILGDISLLKDEYLKAVGLYLKSIDLYRRKSQKEKIKKKALKIISEKLNEEELSWLAGRYGKKFPAEEALYNLIKQKALAGDINGSRRSLERYERTFPDSSRRNELISFIEKKQREGKLIIGCILPLSGALSEIGNSVKEGIITAQIIRSERIGFQQVDLVFKDSAGDPEKAARAFEEFGSNENVIAVIGPVRSACVKKCAPLADKYQLPLVSPTADADYIEGLSNFVFRTCLLPETEAEAMAEFAIKDGEAVEIAIMHGDDYYGRKLAAVFKKKVEELGAKVKIEITYPPETNDFTEYVRKLYSYLEAGGIFDTIYLPCDYDKAGFIIPQLPYNDMEGFQLYGSSGWDSGRFDPYGNPERLLEIVLEKGEIEGAVFTDSFSLWSKDNEERNEFVSRYKEMYDSIPNVYAANSYDTYMMIVKELKKRMKRRSELRKRISQIRDYEGITGKMSIYEKGRVEKTPFFIEIFGGKFREIKAEIEKNG
ncbi:MAG: hypothetical protein D6734_08590 [Candidatus Schekmanbacteria bacterium]|nr:MAG: hypothetical protein D6734_08590 [Candidatus Schekmanbacteria bacterium]